MSKTDTTKILEKRLYSTVIKRGVYGTFEVTLGWYGRERVDFITYDYKHIIRCYEIKASVADFHSSAKKSFVGHYNYYVMPFDVYDKVKDEIPDYIGVYSALTDASENKPSYEIDGKIYWKQLTLLKRPKKQELGIEKDIIMASIIRCLHRDAEKYNNLSQDLQRVEQIRKDCDLKIRKAEKEKDYFKKEYRSILSDIRNIYGNDFYNDFIRKRIN